MPDCPPQPPYIFTDILYYFALASFIYSHDETSQIIRFNLIRWSNTFFSSRKKCIEISIWILLFGYKNFCIDGRLPFLFSVCFSTWKLSPPHPGSVLGQWIINPWLGISNDLFAVALWVFIMINPRKGMLSVSKTSCLPTFFFLCFFIVSDSHNAPIFSFTILAADF